MAEAVRVTCESCGRTIHAPPKYFGKTVKCPECADPVSIPAADEEPEFLDDDAFDTDSSDDPVAQDDDLDDFDRSFGHVSASTRTATNSRRPRSSTERQSTGESKAGLIAGLVMMVVAVVWFVVAWNAGIIDFYPPILFVVGLVALVRGLFGD